MTRTRNLAAGQPTAASTASCTLGWIWSSPRTNDRWSATIHPWCSPMAGGLHPTQMAGLGTAGRDDRRREDSPKKLPAVLCCDRDAVTHRCGLIEGGLDERWSRNPADERRNQDSNRQRPQYDTPSPTLPKNSIVSQVALGGGRRPRSARRGRRLGSFSIQRAGSITPATPFQPAGSPTRATW